MKQLKLQLEIPLVLPGVPDVNDACVRRLMAELVGREGIDEVHVLDGHEGKVAQLCIHYQPEVVSLARIRELVEAAGARISEQFGHVLWPVEGIGYERRARTLAERLRKSSGVLEAEASSAGVVRIEFDRRLTGERELKALIGQMGVTTEVTGGEDQEHPEQDHDHDHGGVLGRNAELVFSLVCGALLGTGYLAGRFGVGPDWLSTGIYAAAYVFGGFFTLREAIDNLRLRKFEIDSLMLVAAGGAAAIGAWAEGALLLFLFSLGHALEHYAMGRARRAIEALSGLAPRTATVRRDGRAIEVPVEALQVGDLVLVRPDERIPADGFIVLGNSSVNQAPITGESIPVDKRPVEDLAAARASAGAVSASSRVFAGTINGSTALEIEVTRLASDSTLSRVVKMVSEAEAQKSPSQRFAAKFERVFVPIVLGLAVLLMFAWVVVDEPFRDSFYRAMAVLVAASPCALAIATPSAVLSAVARAARGGVLVKGGAPLEHLGALTAIAFDKTGTLTEGRPQITDVLPEPGSSREELLRVAVAVESQSDHPLAIAIARDGAAMLSDPVPMNAVGVQSLTGRGVTANIDGQPAWIGKAEMFGSEGVPELAEETLTAIEKLREEGRTTMAVVLRSRTLGAIGLMDTPRESARHASQSLRRLGIKRMGMQPGDDQRGA